MAETSVLRPTTRRRITPPCSATASITSGTPGPRGLAHEEVDEDANDQTAAGRDCQTRDRPELARPLERIARIHEEALRGQLGQPLGATEERGLEQTDRQPKDDGAGRAGQSEEDGHPHHEEVALGVPLPTAETARRDRTAPPGGQSLLQKRSNDSTRP